MALNSKLQLATFFISMVMLSACGGGGGDSAVTPAVTPAVVTTPVIPAVVTTPVIPAVVTTPVTLAVVTTPVTIQSLEGSWRTACQASKALDGYDEQDIFNFKGNTRTTTKSFYAQNTNCKHSAKVIRVREVAGIEFGAVVTPGTNTSHTKINITTTKVLLAAMNVHFTALFNNTGYTGNGSIYYGYGYGHVRINWEIFVWENISSSEAAKTNFKIAESVPDIWQISEKMVDGQSHKVLKMGNQVGNLDSDGRPLALATSSTATQPNKTTSAYTAQAAGLIGRWTYPCRISKGHPVYVQRKILDFEGNKLKTFINIYSTVNTKQCIDRNLISQVEREADIVVGKVINKGAANEYTQIGIKTTKVKVKLTGPLASAFAESYNRENLYHTHMKILYNGYGQTGWKANDWKNISGAPDAITALNIGTQVPDIFKISTVTGGGKELKMGDYQGTFDINGRAMSLEPEAAVLQ